MENAAKALLIAGGVLIALLITGVLVLLVSNVNSLNSTEQEKQAAEQLAKFNKEYESYNKKLLYGTDVITVVNKAIENNKKMDTINDTNSRYYVNVVIKTTNEYKTTVQTTNIITGIMTSSETTDDTLESNKTYKLGDFEGTECKMDDKIINFFNKKIKITQTYTDTEKIIEYPAISDFKKAIFKCEGIEYLDGRVHEITFKEK